MGKIIAIVNQKGGVGKTTTAINLTAALGEQGKKILLVDIDPQGNSTTGLGVQKKSIVASSYDIMVNKSNPLLAIMPTKYKNVSLIPCNMDLVGGEIELIDEDDRESRLKKALAFIQEKYDYIILDCPPSLSIITVNALCAANTVLIPMQCEYYAMEGLSQLMSTVRQVKRLYNSYLDIEGVLLTMYDGRLNLTQQVVSEIKKYFNKQVFSSVIPRSVRLAEAPSFGEPITYYDKNSKAAIAYTDLAKEIIKNNKKQK